MGLRERLAGLAFRVALRLRIVVAALRASGSRALLAIAAVGLGVAATTITQAISAGAERELEAIAARVGVNLLQITPGQVLALPGRGKGWSASSRLDRDDAAFLAERTRDVAAVARVVEGSQRAVLGRESLATNVRGVDASYLELRRFEIASGRGFSAADETERRRVALVGSTVAERLGRGGEMVGETIRIGGAPYEVVGELAKKGMSPDGQNEDDQILVPLETARLRLFGREALSRLVVQASSADRMSIAESVAREILRREHRIAEGTRDDFEIVPMVRTSEIRRRSVGLQQGMSRLFAIATLSLATAGVLAVTLLNVKDRTGEIGLRRAVGARRRDIASLFLGEAFALSVAGGVVGVALGAAASGALASLLGWQMAIAPRVLAAPLAFAGGIGIVSGVVPAWAAARRTPVDALRDR